MEKEIGKVTHYFNKISVVIVDLTDSLSVGDTIHIVGHSTDLTQKVTSMQIEHENVEEAKKGDSVGIKVDERVKEGDVVYKVSE